MLALLVRVQLSPELRDDLTINVSLVSIDAHFCDVPVLDGRICRLVVPLEIYTFDCTGCERMVSRGEFRLTMSEQCPRILPFVWLELPCLTCSEDAKDPVPDILASLSEGYELAGYSPCVLSELLQRVDTIHHDVLCHDIAYWVSTE